MRAKALRRSFIPGVAAGVLGICAVATAAVYALGGPDTWIAGGADWRTSETATSFGFESSLLGARFECKLDGQAFAACRSPVTYSDLPPGRHSFQVRAIDLLGTPDPTPAQRDWTIHSHRGPVPSPRSTVSPPPGIRVASFAAGAFEELDGQSARGHARYEVSGDGGYDDQSALRAKNGGGPGFARGWFDVNWSPGSDVWYGAAFFVPNARAIGYADLLRWDNYVRFGRSGDVGGIEIDDGHAYLMRQDYNGQSFARLGDDFSLPEGRWFTLDVHQRFSADPGAALSEVYLDGERVAASSAPNSRGRRISNLLFGFVFVDGPQSSIGLDRVYADRFP